MAFNEVRRDYLLDRWVVIATSRGRRPTDFSKARSEQEKTNACPLCPGNEHMTPPATLVYLKSGKGFSKTKDENGFRHKDWLVRCIPNLYPAFTPPQKRVSRKQASTGNFALAVGHHEVLVESPDHKEHPADARVSQLTLVLNAYVDRLRELSAKSYVRYVSIFRNHGLEAGASLSHAHSQLIATPTVPRTVAEELEASRKYWKQKKKCVFCNIIEKESAGPRLVLDSKDFVVFTPYASVHPMEFWIFPKKHSATLLSLPPKSLKVLAETMKKCLHGLKTLVNNPPYNYGFHQAVDKSAASHYHWHLEVYPKLAIWAGFEKSTGMYINTVTPEVAAESLRKTLSF
ncbi:MAG: galactose-1-phosphate uridylyltransferase [Candidatus Bathyarchaeia archaeon]